MLYGHVIVVKRSSSVAFKQPFILAYFGALFLLWSLMFLLIIIPRSNTLFIHWEMWGTYLFLKYGEPVVHFVDSICHTWPSNIATEDCTMCFTNLQLSHLNIDFLQPVHNLSFLLVFHLIFFMVFTHILQSRLLTLIFVSLLSASVYLIKPQPVSLTVLNLFSSFLNSCKVYSFALFMTRW